MGPPLMTLVNPPKIPPPYQAPASITFNCSAESQGGGAIITHELYTNTGGVWSMKYNDTANPGDGSLAYTISGISAGTYRYNCRAHDTSPLTGEGWASSNTTFNV